MTWPYTVHNKNALTGPVNCKKTTKFWRSRSPISPNSKCFWKIGSIQIEGHIFGQKPKKSLEPFLRKLRYQPTNQPIINNNTDFVGPGWCRSKKLLEDIPDKRFSKKYFENFGATLDEVVHCIFQELCCFSSLTTLRSKWSSYPNLDLH